MTAQEFTAKLQSMKIDIASLQRHKFKIKKLSKEDMHYLQNEIDMCQRNLSSWAEVLVKTK